MIPWDIFVIVFLSILGGIILFLRESCQNIFIVFPTRYTLEPITTKSQRRVRIILPTGGSGLVQDAEIYQTLIPNSYTIQVDRNSPDIHPEANVEADVNLYLESVHARHSSFPAKEYWLMVNQEYFFLRYAEVVDVLIVKTRYAEKILSEYVKKLALPTRVVYLGHTSLPQSIETDKDWNLLVHFAGRSRQKGTRQLIRMWQRRKGFRHLNPNSRLVITCRDACLNKIIEELRDVPSRDNGWFDPKTGLTVYSRLGDEELANLRCRAGAFICPSIVEGYGHYINEGMASGAVVITSNFPPMNELVPPNRFLIPPEKVVESWEVMEPFGILEPFIIGKYLPNSQACFPNFEELEKLLVEYFTLPDQDKQAIGQLNYQYYLERQAEFRSRLTKFLDEK